MVIVGAGIGGPALGIALKRAGIESIVYEASDEPRDDAGAFLNLAPNGLAVLQALGLGRRLDGLGFQNDRLVFHNETGRTLAEVAVGGVTVMRGAVSRVLREAAEEAGVRFEFGKTLSSVTEHDGNVTVRFADDTTVDGPSLVGADGIHSRTRYSYFTDAPKPTYTGIINLGGVVQNRSSTHRQSDAHDLWAQWLLRYAVRPGGETYWFSNFAQKEEPSRDALMSATSDSYRQQLLEVHGAIRQRSRGSFRLCPDPSARGRCTTSLAAGMASRGGVSDRRCCACCRAARRAGCVARARGRVRAGEVPARHLSGIERILGIRAPQTESRRTHPEAVAAHRAAEGTDGMARTSDPRFDSSDILEERCAGRERTVWLCTRLGETGSVTSDDTVPCSLPVATEPASVYREYTPPPALKEFLICTWTLETLARQSAASAARAARRMFGHRVVWQCTASRRWADDTTGSRHDGRRRKAGRLAIPT